MTARKPKAAHGIAGPIPTPSDSPVELERRCAEYERLEAAYTTARHRLVAAAALGVDLPTAATIAGDDAVHFVARWRQHEAAHDARFHSPDGSMFIAAGAGSRTWASIWPVGLGEPWPVPRRPTMPKSETIRETLEGFAAGSVLIGLRSEPTAIVDRFGAWERRPCIPGTQIASGLWQGLATALATVGWPASESAVAQALSRLSESAAARNEILAADDQQWQAWLEVLRSREQTVDAGTLGEVDAEDDEALATWALTPGGEGWRGARVAWKRVAG